jgi:predicted enzyme related to lactoylglutathione lyase
MPAITGPIPTLPASDLGRATKFYEEVIGLRRSDEEEMPGGVLYELGSGHVWVYESPNAGTARSTQAAWFVDDLAAEVRRLQQYGTEFQTFDTPPEVTWDGVIASSSQLRSAWFTDPEGNTICLDERID